MCATHADTIIEFAILGIGWCYLTYFAFPKGLENRIRYQNDRLAKKEYKSGKEKITKKLVFLQI